VYLHSAVSRVTCDRFLRPLQEYEKRLLAKDHDLKCSQAQLEHIRHELAEAKRIQAEGSNLLPAPEAHEGALWFLDSSKQPALCTIMTVSPKTCSTVCQLSTGVSRCVSTQWHDPWRGMVAYRLSCMLVPACESYREFSPADAFRPAHFALLSYLMRNIPKQDGFKPNLTDIVYILCMQ
jgi:hypothetical protein